MDTIFVLLVTLFHTIQTFKQGIIMRVPLLVKICCIKVKTLGKRKKKKPSEKTTHEKTCSYKKKIPPTWFM